VSGADARSFLQGQLSADIDALTPAHAMLASCNSPQGRVQAVLWLVERADGIGLILPASLTERIAARLRKYVLRSKVQISDSPAATDLVEPPAYRERDWRLAGIRAGLPQVYPQTYETRSARRRRVREGLLYRTGNHRPHAFQRCDQAPHVSL
jgi:hypothetical protein